MLEGYPLYQYDLSVCFLFTDRMTFSRQNSLRTDQPTIEDGRGLTGLIIVTKSPPNLANFNNLFLDNNG